MGHKYFVLIAFIVFFQGCSNLKHKAYVLGLRSADTSKLDRDELSFFEANRKYLQREDVSKWLITETRTQRDEIRKHNQLDSKVAKGKEVESLHAQKANDFLKSNFKVVLGESSSPVCKLLQDKLDVFHQNDLPGPPERAIDLKAYQHGSNFAIIHFRFSGGNNVSFYKCPEYAFDLELSKKVCISSNSESGDACYAIDYWLKSNNQNSLNSIFNSPNELIVFSSKLCKIHKDQIAKDFYCKEEYALKAEMACSASKTGQECLQFIPKLKLTNNLSKALYIAETACVKGNKYGCSMMSSIQQEVLHKENLAMQSRIESQRQQAEANRVFMEGMSRASQQIGDAFRAPASAPVYQAPKQMKCNTKKGAFGGIDTVCDY